MRIYATLRAWLCGIRRLLGVGGLWAWLLIVNELLGLLWKGWPVGNLYRAELGLAPQRDRGRAGCEREECEQD